MFSYKISITNESDQQVQLLNRHWIIIDSNDKRTEVRGEGIIGKQPILKPGESHEYFSFSNMETNFGTMEGFYTMLDENGDEFEITIPRFYLATNLNEFPANEFMRGQVVKHKDSNYKAVVLDYDIYFINDEKWYEADAAKPEKNQPWYYLLIDELSAISYVAQSQLEIHEDQSEIEHPLIDFFFDDFDGKRYLRNDKSWEDLRQQSDAK